MKAGRGRIMGRLSDKRDRNAAPPMVDKHSDEGPAEFQEGQGVKLLIGDRTDIGYRAIINNSREGLLYKNEVFQTLNKGQRIAGFIKKVRSVSKISMAIVIVGRRPVRIPYRLCRKLSPLW